MSDQALVAAFLAKQTVTIVPPAIAKGSNYKAEALAKYVARTARYAAMDAADKAQEAKAEAEAKAGRAALGLAIASALASQTWLDDYTR